MKFQHSPIYRKGKALAAKPLRFRDRMFAEKGPDGQRGGVLCNSFPKSGTHLLLQILRVLPDTTYYGSFLASVPSIRFKLRSPNQHLKRLRAMAPGEVMPAHLYFSPDRADLIKQQKHSHFFVYRDLRDVVVSEAFYLSNMARWHRMSRYFQKADDFEQQLLLSIEGMSHQFPDEYPSIADRFGFYQDWIDHEGCMGVRFEDLISEKREQTIRQIAEFDIQNRGVDFNIDQFVEDATRAIDPSNSHTFRSGKKEGWREHFTPAVAEAFERAAGDLMSKLGYS